MKKQIKPKEKALQYFYIRNDGFCCAKTNSYTLHEMMIKAGFERVSYRRYLEYRKTHRQAGPEEAEVTA